MKKPATAPHLMPPITDGERAHCLAAIKKAVEHATHAYQFCQGDRGYAWWALLAIRQAYAEISSAGIPMLPPKPIVKEAAA